MPRLDLRLPAGLRRRLRGMYTYRPSPESLTWHLLQYLLVLVAAKMVTDSLPTPDLRCRGEPEEEDFCTSSAIEHTRDLVELGPRVFGYESNEVEAVRVVRAAIEEISKNSKKVVELDVQSADGGFFLDLADGVALRYEGLQNVVARLRADWSTEGLLTSPAILVNCHFDSVPLSPGASDDAVNCGIMLEVLRALSGTSDWLVNDVVFLFNGAEETPLPGSHAFITQHHWADRVVAFVNLEAAGAGAGRELLFQSGPGNMWILRTYLKNAPRPSGTVIGQEIFQSGTIPSDTDFRIFRDFGNVSGLDVAFVHNGYVYHTDHDDLSRIEPGSVQRAGENLLAVVKALSARAVPEVRNRDEASPVYFDVAGLASFCYSGHAGTTLSLVACAVCAALIWSDAEEDAKKTGDRKRKILGDLGKVLVCRLFALLFSVLAVTMASLVLMLLLGRTMAWYDLPSLLLPLYALPTVAANIKMAAGLMDYLGQRKTAPRLSALFADAAILEFAILTALGEVFGLRSGYVVQFFVIFPAFALALRKYMSPHWQWWADMGTPLFNPFMLLPLVNYFYLNLLLFDFFVPVMGRRGSDVNPDFIIGTMVVLVTHLVSVFVLPQVPKSGKGHSVAWWLFLGWLGALLSVVFTWVGFPYTEGLALQRLWVVHTKRTFLDRSGNVLISDAGILIEKMDFHDSPELFRAIPGLASEGIILEPDCKDAEFVNCGMPFNGPRLTKKSKRYWMKFGSPQFNSADEVQLRVSQREVSNHSAGANTTVNLHFELRGPPRVVVLMSPSEGANITSWSITAEAAGNASNASAAASAPSNTTRLRWRDRDCFLVTFLRGGGANAGRGGMQGGADGSISSKIFQGEETGGAGGGGEEGSEVASWRFRVDLVVTPSAEAGATLTVVACGHHTHGTLRTASPEFASFLLYFPDWTFPWAWTVDLRGYEVDLR